VIGPLVRMEAQHVNGQSKVNYIRSLSTRNRILTAMSWVVFY